MQNNKWFSPYDSIRRIGSVINVSSGEVTINLTRAGLGEPQWSFGYRIAAGEVNEYIFIDVGETAILGKLIKVWIENGERLSVDGISDEIAKNHPIGIVQLLTSLDSTTGKIFRGIQQYPRLGNQVYSAHPLLVAKLIEGKSANDKNNLFLPLAELPFDNSITIHMIPEQLFSRHCAILGTTGGGKSYSIANLIEQVTKFGGKALIIDPTGEYSSLPSETYYVGLNPRAEAANSAVYPHSLFTDSDIRTLLRPSAQSQSPKLEAAIQSQKIVTHYINKEDYGGLSIINSKILCKADKEKEPYEIASLYVNSLTEITNWSFSNLADQIVHECVYPSGGTYNSPETSKWGKKSDVDVGYCMSLISRVKAYSNNPHLKWMIDPDPKYKTIPSILEELCSTTSKSKIVRLDLSAVPFEANAREILVNAIGRKLLSLARERNISYNNPLLVFIDEAHQFLNKTLGDEFNRYNLDAFGNIAKEGRKYGLNVVIATQRPRDIPEDVLSQIGTLLVHRLTNEMDQNIVKKAVGSIDHRSASFLPTLGQGEALLLGVDFPFPITIKMKKPTYCPSSKSAEFSNSWSKVKRVDELVEE